MSERTDSDSNEQGSGTGAQGAQGQNRETVAQSGSTGQGSQTGSRTDNRQGSEIDLVNHPAYKALASKLDNAISENKKYRDRLRSFVSEDEAEPAGKGTDKNQKVLNDTLQELRSERAYNRLSAAATKAGFRTPDVILNFVKLDEVADEKGNVTDPDTVINNLKTKYPDMFRAVQEGNGDGAAGNRNRNGNGSSDMNAMIRSRLRGNS